MRPRATRQRGAARTAYSAGASNRLRTAILQKYAAALGLCVFAIACGAQVFGATIATQRVQEPPPNWAFAVDPPALPAAAPTQTDDTPHHVPGSAAAFTLTQIRNLFSAPDWHPSDHPAMPEIVAHGRAPEVFACGYCHLPNGQGRPENSRLAGLSARYIVEQVAAFKSGQRKSSDPRHKPSALMAGLAAKVSEQEVQIAAEYFATLKPLPWIRVVETSTVPITHVAGWMLVASEPPATEAIGRRIIETAENLERTELRDDASGFVAYVPRGSVRTGNALVATGGAGKTLPCATCHGPQLKGLVDVPALAGRSPSYLMRQMVDIRNGARAGPSVESMRAVVEKLTPEDMLAIAAYAASLNPQETPE